ncbi:MAG: hypothetical protein FJZ07_01125 [Candidatus Nealsonbacteria bacterium]|nr:hypothetical protein [Candidatus Nealsonbacteria bacterium]
MRKISLVLISLVLVGFGAGVLAQASELPDPGMLPDSPFYFLKRLSEGIGTLFTFGDLAKAERHTQLASKRLAEAKALVEKGREDIGEKVLARYQEQLERALNKAQQAGVRGKSIVEVTEVVTETTVKHLSVLEEVLDRVPEQTRGAIERAREVSMTGQKSALRALAWENPERATEINLKAVESKLNRAKAKAEQGEIEDMEEAIRGFENQNRFGEEISQIAQAVGKDITVLEQLVGRATSVHLEILSEVYEKVPEQAREAIEKAMEVSIRGHERAIEVLKKGLEEAPETLERILEEMPEDVLSPIERIPQEVRQKIQERVREEKD